MADHMEQTLAPHEQNELMIFQESSIDPVASYIVFAPIDIANMQLLMMGEDSSQLSVLPSGFMITGDADSIHRDAFGRRSEGTLLTVAYQYLVCGTASIRGLRMGSLRTVNNTFRRVVDNIQAAMGCPNVD